MKIVTLNIWDLPLWFVPHRKERIHAIAAYLNELNADIICLQESFDPRHRALLHALLNNYHTSDVDHAKRKMFFISFDTTGGLVIFSKFPIIEQTFFKFSGLFFRPIEFFAEKGILTALINTPRGILRVINTHLHFNGSWYNDAIRMHQMRHIFTILRKRNDITPTIIAGDFNIHNLPDDKECLALIREHNFIHPFTPMLDPSYRKENPYVNRAVNRIRSSKRLDYILYNNVDLLNLKVGYYGVLYPDNSFSDHDPVILELI